MDILIRAFALLHCRDVRLLIAGSDDGQERALRRLVKELALRNVAFLGFIDGADKAFMLWKADVVVVPSRSEVFSLTAGEAWTIGTPVLVSSECGFPKEYATQFESENPNDLARKLDAILEGL